MREDIKREETLEAAETHLEDADLETAAGGAPLCIPRVTPRGTMDDRSLSARVPGKTPEGTSIPGWLDRAAPWLKDVEASARQGEQA